MLYLVDRGQSALLTKEVTEHGVIIPFCRIGFGVVDIS
jgi:hypothetical protein